MHISPFSWVDMLWFSSLVNLLKAAQGKPGCQMHLRHLVSSYSYPTTLEAVRWCLLAMPYILLIHRYELFRLSRKQIAYRECDSEMDGRVCGRGRCHICTLPFVLWTLRSIVHQKDDLHLRRGLKCILNI